MTLRPLMPRSIPGGASARPRAHPWRRRRARTPAVSSACRAASGISSPGSRDDLRRVGAAGAEPWSPATGSAIWCQREFVAARRSPSPAWRPAPGSSALPDRAPARRAWRRDPCLPSAVPPSRAMTALWLAYPCSWPSDPSLPWGLPRQALARVLSRAAGQPGGPLQRSCPFSSDPSLPWETALRQPSRAFWNDPPRPRCRSLHHRWSIRRGRSSRRRQAGAPR